MVILKIKISKDVIVYEEENEIILVNMLKNNFYALDEFSSLMWKKIIEFGDVIRLINFINETYRIDKEIIKKDIHEFIYNLEKVGVIKVYE